MADIIARSLVPMEVACRAVDSGRFDTALWWLAHEHQVGNRHALTITDAMKDGATPSPTPLQRGAQAGDEVLAQHQFLGAGVLDNLPVESWKEVRAHDRSN